MMHLVQVNFWSISAIDSLLIFSIYTDVTTASKFLIDGYTQAQE